MLGGEFADGWTFFAKDGWFHRWVNFVNPKGCVCEKMVWRVVSLGGQSRTHNTS